MAGCAGVLVCGEGGMEAGELGQRRGVHAGYSGAHTHTHTHIDAAENTATHAKAAHPPHFPAPHNPHARKHPLIYVCLYVILYNDVYMCIYARRPLPPHPPTYPFPPPPPSPTFLNVLESATNL